VQSLRQAVGKVDFADEPDTAEAVYLELAERRSWRSTFPRQPAPWPISVTREPASLSGHMRLMAVAWALGDWPKRGAASPDPDPGAHHIRAHSPPWRGFWRPGAATTKPGALIFARPGQGRGSGNRGSLRTFSRRMARPRVRPPSSWPGVICFSPRSALGTVALRVLASPA